MRARMSTVHFPNTVFAISRLNSTFRAMSFGGRIDAAWATSRLNRDETSAKSANLAARSVRSGACPPSKSTSRSLPFEGDLAPGAPGTVRLARSVRLSSGSPLIAISARHDEFLDVRVPDVVGVVHDMFAGSTQSGNQPISWSRRYFSSSPSSTGGSSCSNLSTQEASKREPSCFPCSFRPTASTMANRVPTAHTIRELSPRTLPDFETLAAKQGGCWCIFYQRAKPLRRGTTSGEWKRRNRRDKRRLVRECRSHAILVYDGKTAIGWCQYGDRNELPRIDARRTYRTAAPQVGDVKLLIITY